MKLKKYITLGLLGITSFTSCKLDLTPYDVIDQEGAFTSVADAKKWDTRFYSDLRSRVWGHYIQSPDIQADQLNAAADFGNNYGDVHRWTNFLADNYQLRDVWAGYYSALVNVNTAIEGFKKITPSLDKDVAELKQYVGDAHLMRAYYYFMLVTRYAKSYDAATSSTDLGVPLVLTPDLGGQPARATVKEVYDQILSDLAIAKANLAPVAGVANAKRFNSDVATAFEARIKLFMKDWSGAKIAAETLIKGGKYELYKTADELKEMWYKDKGNEVIFAPFVSISELPNTNTIYLGLNETDKKYRPSFFPSQWVYDAYDAADFRKDIYFLKDATVVQGGIDYTVTLVNKYPGNKELYSGTATNYAHSQKMFRIAETYLIAAEASYNAGASNEALTHLNSLRTARGLKALSGVSGANLLAEIKNERFRELAFEGFRLDDLKRWGEGFSRKNPQSPSEIIQEGSEYTTKTVAAGDDKFVWGIPSRDITINLNLIQNKGW